MVDRNGRWRRSGVVLGTIWSRGTGRYSLIVLGSWMVVALVSLFWTPQSLLATCGISRRPRIGWAPTAPARMC